MAAETSAPPANTWSFRQGLVTAAMLLAAIFAGLGGYFLATRPALPVFDGEAHLENFDQTMEQLSPANAWLAWQQIYRPLRRTGFGELKHRDEVEIADRRIRYSWYAGTALGTAMLWAIAAASANLLLRPG